MKPISIALAFSMTMTAVAGPTAGSTRAIGATTAPITIDLYSDFQCPHCKDLHDQVLPSLIHDYVNTGKVYLVRHYYLLPQFRYSRLAASYAAAAEKIGKYDAVCDALFAKQQLWGQTGKVDEVACAVLSPADAQRVRALAKDASVATMIDSDTATGVAQNVKATPTLIVMHNGQRTPIDVQVSYPILKRFLDGMLAR
jgi:protein-disulfide isomerase